jgi:hypothetical protein
MGVPNNYSSDFGITVVIVGIGHASEPYSAFDCGLKIKVPPTATTCPLWTSWSPLLVVTEV